MDIRRCIIHTELVRLTSSKWWFICINGEKTLKTTWNELEDEFPEIFTHCSLQLLENADTTQVGHHPLTEAEKRKRDAGTTEETITIDRLWNKRPDGFAIKKPTETKGGEFVIQEFKHMSCVTDQYVKRAKHVVEAQYTSMKSDLQRKIPRRGGLTRQPHLFQGPTGRHRLH
jgi:hypothetical protein